MNCSRSVLFLTILLLFLPSFSFAEVPAEAAFIVGEWESTDATNRYRMRISWSNAKNEFYGTLTKNGEASSWVGFQVNEHIFTAKYFQTPSILVVVQKYRSGSNRVSNWEAWVPASIDVEASSQNRLVANYPERLGETTLSYYVRISP